MKTKTEAALGAIGIYLAFNAFVFVAAYVLAWVSKSPIGQWLEIDRPSKPYVPGTVWLLQIFPILIAFQYYRDKVKRE